MYALLTCTLQRWRCDLNARPCACWIQRRLAACVFVSAATILHCAFDAWDITVITISIVVVVIPIVIILMIIVVVVAVGHVFRVDFFQRNRTPPRRGVHVCVRNTNNNNNTWWCRRLFVRCRRTTACANQIDRHSAAKCDMETRRAINPPRPRQSRVSSRVYMHK